ncbi:MAG TPA: hypothetical protein DCG19_10730 [Cryomorphaceae bacterium]|nr:hypothetical protein [Owenweeksia sp.]MBF98705.1 hypothetical protein [Owenweeksia sp.]HAD97871.1 hypothetical protein [Cryomorphaceae bacterium]HBF22116.1 hypothetical protein [Cryomorphaceae bacterium]HCQ15894.1 hypothetical protein [Cryomorphaceae bacterium]|tara:strand:- start:634 stop:1134 length:501 start_codon:yes stop_codon:yes gene_type:complete
MTQTKKDFVAEAIADYEAMTAAEQGKMVVQILEDQPVLMGFITNLADDFSDSEHEALVDSAVILIDAFVAAGIPVQMVPHQMVEEVINEKVDQYNKKDEHEELSSEAVRDVSDSPLVFEDLKNRAVFKSNLSEEDEAGRQNFNIVLDTIISIIERSAAATMEKKTD